MEKKTGQHSFEFKLNVKTKLQAYNEIINNQIPQD